MNNNNKIDWEQIARYLSDECSPEERAVLEAKLSQDHSFRRVFDEARDTWMATGRPDEGIDQQRAWSALDSRLQQKQDASAPLKLVRQPLKDSAPVPHRRVIPRRTPVWRVITLATILTAVTFIALQEWRFTSPEKPEQAIFMTTAGQRASVTLPDGSEAMLNAESQIQLVSSSWDSQRIVTLEGEAFFDIASDSLRPFIIQAGNAEVEVLGTAFNMSAYPESGIQVAVTEGVVNLRSSQARQGVILKESDIGVVREGSNAVVDHTLSMHQLLAWKEGILVFDRTNFDEVARTLERWFSLDIRTTSNLSQRHLTAEFSDPAPNQVVAIIATTLGLDYVIEGNTVTFSEPTAL